MPSTMNEELLREFLIESHENLDRLDTELVHLEQSPHDRATLASVFRTIHTIKGSCGFLALDRLEHISHAGEALLSRMRDGELILDADITTALLAMVDAIRAILATIEETGVEGDAEYASLVASLTRLTGRTPLTVQASGSERAKDTAGTPPPDVAHAADVDDADTHDDSGSAIVGDRRMSWAAEDRRTSSVSEDRRISSAADSTLRIDVGLLDTLMNLVGELVLARNQILQFRATRHDAAFVTTTQRLNLVTSELQEAVLKTRMQPIDSLWSKLPRVVRDLATQCRKQVRLEMEGNATELDKTIIEAIKDPLTHVLRNAVDHGIESPETRVSQGKGAEGRIRLSAYHESGQINIEMSDDGAGIDPSKVSARAIRRGLITAEQASRMSASDLVRLVFLPGFSTADSVSTLSGRGVGLDVVKTNVERIGGQVNVQSAVGKGTSLTIRIPLTLTIIPALMIGGAEGERYAIPQANLLELVRLEGAAAQAIEQIQTALFYRLRGNLMPLISLNRVLGLADGPSGPAEAVHIVVLSADGQQFGLLVESINDTEEIVVKPLNPQLKGVQVFAGATILGDGGVALILDVLALAQCAHLDARARTQGELARHAPAASPLDGSRETLLLVRVGQSGRMALDLRGVARLEEFPMEAVERSGNQALVQYRGGIMPLVDIPRYFNFHDPTTGVGSIQVVVCTSGDGSVGLIVDQILDIVSGTYPVQYRSGTPGVLGSVVIDDRVTDLLDMRAVLPVHEAELISVGAA